MDNLKEMDRLLEKLNLIRLNQEAIEIMNRLITSPEIETVIKISPENKSRGPDGFTGEFYPTFRDKLMPMLLPKNWRGKNTSKLILQSHHYFDAKTRQRHHKKRKLQANITDEHRCKNPQQNSSKQNPATH